MVRNPPNCDVHARGQQCPLNVEPDVASTSQKRKHRSFAESFANGEIDRYQLIPVSSISLPSLGKSPALSGSLCYLEFC